MSKMNQLKQLRSIINQVISPVRNRVMMLVSRGLLELVKDSNGIQLVKVNLLAGEARDNVERFQQYGLTSNPQPGAECIAIFQGGNREAGIIISIDDRRFRLKNLADGEVALYTDEGDKLHFKRNSTIIIESDNVEIGRGTLEKIVNGETFKTFFNNHIHNGNLGVPTGPPITAMSDTQLSGVVKAAK